jgi:cytochrome d ubiquinol oxidase subunit II
MLIGLSLRGVAFEFRVKARAEHKPAWDFAFFGGSLLAAVSQGVMLGLTIVGFRHDAATWVFALFIGAGLAAGYALLGATWLVMKTHGALQLAAVRWAQQAKWLTAAGIGAVSIATPLVSTRIAGKWFALPEFFMLLPIPLATLLLFFILWRALARLPQRLAEGNEYGAWVPFACAVGIFICAFYGLAYSLFPYLVVDRTTIWDAASAPESLVIILVGACVVLPVILAYTVFAWRVFGGKARLLSYG